MCNEIKVPVISMEGTGLKLKNLREEHGYTRKELANLLNASYTAVSNWETGRKLPSIDKLVLLASIYSTHIESLLHINYLKGYKNQFTSELQYELPPDEILIEDLKNNTSIDWSNWVFYDKNNNLANGEYITKNSKYIFHDGLLSVSSSSKEKK